MEKAAQPAFAVSNETTEKRFTALNGERLSRVYDSLTGRQRDFLDALPLLFHTNHPLLPGYLAKDTPAGIANFNPGQQNIRAARNLSRSFEFDRRSVSRQALSGLYMMGSPGTIAYSRKSDLDMWLMHAPGLDAKAVEQLKEKARRIEQFAETLALEVHFFVFDATSFRSGEDLSLSDESSGSTQHYLLLDEFYRSSLLVAGLPPLWWRVPGCHEHDYEAYVEAVEARRVIDRGNYIDFGALPDIPVDEFFGAAVWQLYKSIHSPYKSVLKLLLMEAYAAKHPDTTLLSVRFKLDVEAGELDLDALDPYILMYRHVEEYLKSSDDAMRLDVLRRSFYLKANVLISRTDRRANDDWRVAVMQRLVGDWGWSPEQIQRLDQRADWGLDVAIEERRDLTNTLKRSYATLSRFARDHANDSKITKTDLHALGRKLYAAFEKKPSKIEVVTRGICADPVEDSLSLHEVRGEGNSHFWLLFVGSVSPADSAALQPAKRSGSAAEIILWCHLNRLAGEGTTWHVFTTNSRLTAAEVKRVNSTLAKTLIGNDGEAVGGEAGGRRRISRVVLLVNVGVDPFSGAFSSGNVLTSDHVDPLAYGGRGMNLVRTIDLLFMTTWNEAFAFRYEGSRAVLEALAECLQWVVTERTDSDLPDIETRCFNAECAQAITKRVASLFGDAMTFMTRNWRRETPHLVIQADENLHHLRLEKGRPLIESYNSQALLLRALGSTDADSPLNVRFDRSCTRAGLLPYIYRHNRIGTIQIFAHRRGPAADVFVVDERGRLLVHRQECYSMAVLLQHYRRFLNAALQRCEPGFNGDLPLEIEACELSVGDKHPQIKHYPEDLSDNQNYLALHVLADADSEGHQQFTIYTGDREFSTWEHGVALFSHVAEFVLAQRGTGEVYPIYITDLDLSTRFRQLVGVKALRPFDLLSYKKRIEYQLTRALLNDTTQPGSAVTLAS